MFSKKKFANVSNLNFICMANVCSAELSMKKGFVTSRPGAMISPQWLELCLEQISMIPKIAIEV